MSTSTRHQAWVIARIKPFLNRPPQYRCIAAVQHTRTTRMLSAPSSAASKGSMVLACTIAQWYRRLPVHSPISFLGSRGALTRCLRLGPPGAFYATGLFVHPKCGCWDLQNDGDGISVIDVTDPEHPKYCFAVHGRYQPLSAQAYCRYYYDDWDKNRDNTERSHFQQGCSLVDGLGLDVITSKMLTEAFHRSSLESEYAVATGHEDDGATRGVFSLVDLIFDVALVHALNTGDAAWFSQMLWLPGNAARAKRFFLRQSPFPEHGVPFFLLLLDELGESSSIDLSGFDIHPEQVLQLLTTREDKENLRALNLSHNARITARTAHDILRMFPTMERIVLMDCLAVENIALRKLVETQPTLFYHTKALLHPLFVALHHHEPPEYPVAFSFFSLHTYGDWEGQKEVLGCSLPFLSLDVLIQALTDFFRVVNHCQNHGRLEYGSSNIITAAAFTGVRPSSDTEWGKQSVAFIPGLSLDALVGGEDGWCFAWDLKETKNLHSRSRSSRRKSRWTGRWAFLRLREWEQSDSAPSTRPSSAVEVHGLGSFLRIVTAEGRPAPAATAFGTRLVRSRTTPLTIV